jgi:hypothetical protein
MDPNYLPPGRVQGHLRWNPRNFWSMITRGTQGYVQPRGSLPGTVSMVPHRVTQYRRPSFWDPLMHFQRREFMVRPPMLPGTAIPFTLFHPVYIPGQQGWMNTTPWNFAVAWNQINFEKANTIGFLAVHPATGQGSRINAWRPDMIGRPFGDARVFQQPRPFYVPPIINPSVKS